VKKFVGGASALALLTAASASHAQTAANADVDAIIVTGTRSMSRTVTSSLAPIDVLSNVELTKSGKLSTRDLITTLVPSAFTSNSGAGASFAVKTLSLRGLSGDQTLVLVNGKRRHNTAILFVNGTTQNGQSPPDLDLIPSASVEHIEVLRDGASAQYGSDALAGVVNIILKKAPEGGSLTALYGKTGEGDGETGQLSGNIGFSLGDQGGYINLTGDVKTQDFTDRGITPIPRTTQFYPRINGALDPREATVDRNGRSHPGSPMVQLYSMGVSAGLPITDDIDFYTFSTVTRRKSTAWLTFRLPASNNNVPSVTPEGYTPKLFINDADFQTVAGFEGTNLFGAGIGWDLSTSLARDNVEYHESSLNTSLGAASPTYFYLGKLVSQEFTNNLDLTKEVQLGALSKPLFVAAGLEYRRNKYTIGLGEQTSYIIGTATVPVGQSSGVGTPAAGGAQGVSGFGPLSAGAFSRSNWSAYINFEQSFGDKVDLSLAGRHEDYSDFGTADTAKVSGRFAPIEAFAIRATASTGFRAPSLPQQHYASSSTIGVLLPGATSTVLYPVQLLPPDSAAAMALGAKPLEPEKSTNYSVGFVAKPLSGLSLTLDVYQIKIKDRIMQSATLGGSPVAVQIAVSNGLRTAGVNPNQAAFYYANAADTTTKGLDFVADYRTDFGSFGAVKWTLSANYNKTRFDRITSPPAALAALGAVLIDRVKIGDFTKATPKSKYIASANWSLDKYSAILRLTRFGPVKQTATAVANDEYVSPALIVDLDLTYAITDSLTATLGANNLLNKFPDKVSATNQGLNGSITAVPFSAYNQYSPYGIGGSFIYTRLAYSF
jgi:iron complex outermembrane receptor protein